MPAFTHVLCPIDFSDTSRRALRYATVLAAWYGARLTVLHVMPPEGEVPMAAGLGEGPVVLPAPSRTAVADHLARDAAAAGADPSRLSCEVASGQPHRVVLDRIDALGADLLVRGTHGRGGFERLFLGSVTEKLLRSSPRPVLTVPPGAHDPAAVVAFHQVLCPLDFSPSSTRAFSLAIDLARQSGGEVTALHAIEYVDPREPCEHEDPHVRASRSTLIAHFRERLHQEATAHAGAGVIHEVLAVNRAYREILDRAAALPADLIVMGAQGHGGIELMFYGSTTQHVVRRATCPVLTVRA